jgi:hypothetical protein
MRPGRGSVGVLGALVLAACVGGQPSSTAAGSDTTKPRASDAALAVPAPPVDAMLAVPEIADAGAPLKTEEVEGFGRCKVDSDCELSSWQPGCGCTASCVGYAISTSEMQKRMASETCPAVRTEPCPPPAPCPVIKHRPLHAVCRKGTCYEVRALLP